jgi:hypothetical protein
LTLLRNYRPEVKLQRLLARPGGLTIEQALARATLNVEKLREQCTTAVDAKIEEIAALGIQAEINAQAIYALSDEIFALAGTFKMGEVSQAAYSLCALLSSPEGAKSAAAIRVHVDALRALRNPEIAANLAATAQVLQGLKNVSKRFGATDGLVVPRG